MVMFRAGQGGAAADHFWQRGGGMEAFSALQAPDRRQSQRVAIKVKRILFNQSHDVVAVEADGN
jgi:hypothetical protein